MTRPDTNLHDLRALLLRAVGAIETPDDLTQDEVQDLIEDLQAEANRIEGQISIIAEDPPIRRPGDLVGLSLSMCIRDIIDGTVPLDRVARIIAGTMARDEEEWQLLFTSYAQTYWKKNPVKAREVLDYLRRNDLIDQPRTRSQDPEPIMGGHWRAAQ